MRKRNFLGGQLLAGAVCAIVLFEISHASAQSNAPRPTPPAVTHPFSGPLIAARFLQCKAVFSAPIKGGTLQPMFALNIQIQRGPTPNYNLDKIRIDMAAVSKPRNDGATTPNSEYLFNGKNEYEANGLIRQYTVEDAPAAGQRSHSQMRDMAGIDLFLHPSLSSAMENPGVKKEVASDTLNGSAVQVTTYTQPPRKGRDGAVFTPSQRLWIDAKTGLPQRVQQCLIDENGVSRTLMQTDYTAWQINVPISANRFVWTPPSGFTAKASPKLLSSGTIAPDFTAYSPEGKAVKLSDYKGKTVILDFWATWCGPCQRSMPHLDKVYSQVKDQNVVVLAVCVWDTKNEYDKWVSAKKGIYSFSTFFDPAGRDKGNIAGSLYKVESIPTQYLIDKNGMIAASHLGFSGDADQSLERALGKLGIVFPPADNLP